MKKSTNFLLTIIVIAIIALSTTLTVFMLTSKKDSENKNENKSGVVKEEDSNPTSDASLAYSNIVSISGDKLDLYIKNPGSASKSVKVYVVAYVDEKEVTLASSEIIKSGYAIYDMDLDDDVTIEKGKYKGYFLIKYYDSKDNSESIVDTKIDIQISVK